jgi:hypothetical protein
MNLSVSFLGRLFRGIEARGTLLDFRHPLLRVAK